MQAVTTPDNRVIVVGSMFDRSSIIVLVLLNQLFAEIT